MVSLSFQLNSALTKVSQELARKKARGDNSSLVMKQQQEVEELLRVGN